MFFFEKKNQKTFATSARVFQRAWAKSEKFFASFFQKRRVFLLFFCFPAQAAEPGCGQIRVDGTTPPATTAFITPRVPVQPFYQWENDDGYCGEVSLMQAGLNNGQFMSQFNARLVCGTGLSQTGANGQCAMHKQTPNYNAQVLLEVPGTGVSGPNVYANAPICVANARLSGTPYNGAAQPPGMAGYEQYLSWVKAQVIAGNQVTVGVILHGGNDPQYDHEVAVMKIGTNHSVTDPTYYPDDVLYFDEHGVYTLNGTKFTNNPSVPPGAGAGGTGCTPYIFGYSFAQLAQTRASENEKGALAYGIIIPDNRVIQSYAGGSGYASVPILGPHNYGMSVSGPADPGNETLPVSVTIAGPTKSSGIVNKADPVAGYNYENPKIGVSNLGNSCTNTQPVPMTNVVLRASIMGLTAGTAYNLYEYDFSAISGSGTQAALAVPVADFNAKAAMASAVTHFIASSSSYTHSVTTTSDKIVVFRAVPADGP